MYCLQSACAAPPFLNLMFLLLLILFLLLWLLLSWLRYGQAVSIATVPNQAVGQNHQIFEMGATPSSNRIATIESAPHNASSVLILSVVQGNDSTYFHANEYIRLSVEQIPQPSSVHREERYKEIGPPHQLQDIMKILGDTEDKEYPIYRCETLFMLVFVGVNNDNNNKNNNNKARPFFSSLSLSLGGLAHCFPCLVAAASQNWSTRHLYTINHGIRSCQWYNHILHRQPQFGSDCNSFRRIVNT